MKKYKASKDSWAAASSFAQKKQIMIKIPYLRLPSSSLWSEWNLAEDSKWNKRKEKSENRLHLFPKSTYLLGCVFPLVFVVDSVQMNTRNEHSCSYPMSSATVVSIWIFDYVDLDVYNYIQYIYLYISKIVLAQHLMFDSLCDIVLYSANWKLICSIMSKCYY